MNKLEKKDRKRIEEKLENAQSNPGLYFQRLAGVKLFKLRVGDHRIIAQINNVEKKIILVNVDHRKKVYQNL